MKKIFGLILAKSDSTRLENKNILPFNGEPMFLINVEKCLKIFEKTYVSSDSDEILDWADSRGAVAIKRPQRLCGNTPNIPVYQHAIGFMGECDGIVAVQANSPNVSSNIIKRTKNALEVCDEIMTIHPDGSIYGSVWGLSRGKLLSYQNFYSPEPQVRIEDLSIDVHTMEDYLEALDVAQSMGYRKNGNNVV